MEKIWLIDRDSRERLYRLTPARGPRAVRLQEAVQASAVQEALCLPLIERQRRDGLWFECSCRRVGSQYPDFHTRRLG